jgi:hypothetical protein
MITAIVSFIHSEDGMLLVHALIISVVITFGIAYLDYRKMR